MAPTIKLDTLKSQGPVGIVKGNVTDFWYKEKSPVIFPPTGYPMQQDRMYFEKQQGLLSCLLDQTSMMLVFLTFTIPIIVYPHQQHLPFIGFQPFRILPFEDLIDCSFR